MDKKELSEQIANAFDFIQKLYNESAYLIKEIEGQLVENEFNFQILKTSGYSVSTRSSTGLETNNVQLWLMRKLAVAFAEDRYTNVQKGQNVTEINDDLKVLYFRIILNDSVGNEPELLFGVFYNVAKYKDWIKKFENLIGQFEYVDNKLFAQFPSVNYQDGTFSIKGKFKKVKLLDINSSDELKQKVLEPAIELYKKV